MCARASARRMLASLLERRRCPDPHELTSGAVARAIGPEASGDRPSARSCTVVGKLRRWGISLCSRSGSRAPVGHATDTIKAAGDGHRSAPKPCRVWGLPAAPAGAAPSLGYTEHPCAAATVRRRRCVARRAPCRRRRASVREPPNVAVPPARGRACVDAVAQQSRGTPRPPTQ